MSGSSDQQPDMARGVTAATLPVDLGPQDVVLLGWPVGHSLSPAMHTAAFASLGLDLRYRALPVSPDDLLTVVAELGVRGLVGANVTVPHKLAVLAACTTVTEEARRVGAVNTLIWSAARAGGRVAPVLEGDNTDAAGLERALREEVRPLGGEPVLVVGTGGAARAAVVALARLGAEVSVAGRSLARANELAALASSLGVGVSTAVDLADPVALHAAVAVTRLVVNATSLGLAGEHLPAACEQLEAGQVAYDLVYRPEVTPFLAAARARGAAAHGGLGMLVHQAAAAAERWTGRPAPVAVLRAAAERALAC
jgi:shikimate dehydrogenase